MASQKFSIDIMYSKAASEISEVGFCHPFTGDISGAIQMAQDLAVKAASFGHEVHQVHIVFMPYN